MAEREGFEPPDPFGSTVFKTAAIDRSATSPAGKNLYLLFLTRSGLTGVVLIFSTISAVISG